MVMRYYLNLKFHVRYDTLLWITSAHCTNRKGDATVRKFPTVCHLQGHAVLVSAAMTTANRRSGQHSLDNAPLCKKPARHIKAVDIPRCLVSPIVPSNEV